MGLHALYVAGGSHALPQQSLYQKEREPGEGVQSVRLVRGVVVQFSWFPARSPIEGSSLVTGGEFVVHSLLRGFPDVAIPC